MRTFLGIGCAIASAAFSLSAHAAEAELAAPIAACIRDNAAKVEQAVSSLTDGTSFLVDSLCAAPIAAEQSRRTREWYDAMARKQRELCEAYKANAGAAPRRAPAGGEIGLDPCALADSYSDTMSQSYLVYGGTRLLGGNADAASLAARLLLDLRLARLARERRR